MLVVVELVLCIFIFPLNISVNSALFIGIAIGVIFLILGFYKTETGIKSKFGDDKS